MSYTAEQPKHGQIVLHCGHKDALAHFWKHSGKVAGPEGMVEVHWLCACDMCSLRAEAAPSRIAWMELATWQGNAPVIKAQG